MESNEVSRHGRSGRFAGVGAGLVVFLLTVAPGALAQPYAPFSNEFRVNFATMDDQDHPAVAAGLGGFVVVFRRDPFVGFREIDGQRFTPLGATIGPQARVNTFTSTGDQEQPSVAFFSDETAPNAYVVAWKSFGHDGTASAIWAQRYNGATSLGAEFRVNAITTTNQSAPAVASSGDGTFVVAWTEEMGAGNTDVRVRHYSGAGPALTGELNVNQYTLGLQEAPAVAAEPSGNVFVVYAGQSGFPEAGFDIFGRRYSSPLSPLGEGFRINAATTGEQLNPAIAAAAGGFVVVWETPGEAAPAAAVREALSAGTPEPAAIEPLGADVGPDIMGRRFTAAGVPVGAEFLVNSQTYGAQSNPSIASDAEGNFIVTFTAGGSGLDVYARRFLATGEPVGIQFRVNTYSTGTQNNSRVALLPAGDFMVTWSSTGQDGSGEGLYAQLYCALSGDADGNSVLGVGDVLYLINHLFAGGPAPAARADVNADGVTNISDALYLINYLFAGGPVPACRSLLP